MTTDRETWARHALIALGMLPFFLVGLHVLPRWAQPAAYATGYYLFREIEQAIAGGIARDRILDGILDVVTPGAWTLLICGLLWVGGVEW